VPKKGGAEKGGKKKNQKGKKNVLKPKKKENLNRLNQSYKKRLIKGVGRGGNKGHQKSKTKSLRKKSPIMEALRNAPRHKSALKQGGGGISKRLPLGISYKFHTNEKKKETCHGQNGGGCWT